MHSFGNGFRRDDALNSSSGYACELRVDRVSEALGVTLTDIATAAVLGMWLAATVRGKEGSCKFTGGYHEERRRLLSNRATDRRGNNRGRERARIASAQERQTGGARRISGSVSQDDNDGGASLFQRRKCIRYLCNTGAYGDARLINYEWLQERLRLRAGSRQPRCRDQ